jgi:uncharacterized damage-inducible protein DinB
MKENFIELFEYNNHFNQKLIELIVENQMITSERIQKLLNHLINAQQIWNARILGLEQFQVWQINEWSQLPSIDSNNYNTTLKIVNNHDLNASIEYANSKGDVFSNKIKDVLYHVINHSTYHRAQIATELKQNGIEPINTDYIFYKRRIKN